MAESPLGQGPGTPPPRPAPMRLALATLALCCSGALAFQAAPRHVSASSRSFSVPIFAREGDKDAMGGAVGGAVLGGLLAGP